MSDFKTTGETTVALTAEHTGRWLVTTEHSRHIWDLDQMTYTRLPEYPDAQPHEHDGAVVEIERVVRWPKVGARPLLWFYEPGLPRHFKDCRMNTAVVKIERLADEDGDQA